MEISNGLRVGERFAQEETENGKEKERASECASERVNERTRVTVGCAGEKDGGRGNWRGGDGGGGRLLSWKPDAACRGKKPR